MEFHAWEPEYQRILREFGFSREADGEAAEELRRALARAPHALPSLLAEAALRLRLGGKDALLVGGGPGLLPLPLPSPWLPGGRWTVVAADGATSRCLAHGTVPDLIVTDLDGDLEDEVEASRRGALVLIHAHGDNRPALRDWVTRFPGPIAGTCAGAPGRGLLNPGGFTDGDRGLFVAEAFGASTALLAGYDFRHPRGEPPATQAVKQRKLAVALRLVRQVAGRGKLRVERLDDSMHRRPFAES